MGKVHDLYVAKRLLSEENEYGVKTAKFEKPKLLAASCWPGSIALIPLLIISAI